MNLFYLNKIKLASILFLLVNSFCIANSSDTASTKGWWLGFEANRSATLFYMQNEYSDVFYQDLPTTIKTEYVGANECCLANRTKTNVWENANKQGAKIDGKNRDKFIYSLYLNYNTNKYTHTFSLGYMAESNLLYSGQVKNEEIRRAVYQYNPNFVLRYILPSPRSHAHSEELFRIQSPAYLARYDIQTLALQYYFSKNKFSKKRTTLKLMPGIEYLMLLKEKSYYGFIGYFIDTSYSSYTYFTATKENRYFKPYALKMLLKTSIDVRLSKKMFLSGNVLVQFPPFWQNKNTMELVRTSRIGVGLSLNYFFSRKKCKVCPIQ